MAEGICYSASLFGGKINNQHGLINFPPFSKKKECYGGYQDKKY